MSDAATFLRAIIAAPADDFPRLQMADWLRDRGDEARAEFIAVQCELASLPLTVPAVCNRCGRTENRKSWSLQSRCQKCKGSMRREDGSKVPHNTADPKCPQVALRRREKSLLERHWIEWGVSIPAGDGRDYTYCAGLYPHDPPPGNSIRFRRGFVDAVTCDLQSWLSHGPAVVRSTPILSVTLSDRRPLRDVRYLWQEDANTHIDAAFCLPPSIFANLKRYTHHSHREQVRHYPTEAAALADLSAAAILWARATADHQDREAAERKAGIAMAVDAIYG